MTHIGKYSVFYVSLGIGLCLLLLLGWFVWPTPYRYDVLKRGDNSLPVRINRLTGNAEVLSSQGWTLLGADKTDKSKLKPLSQDELAKLEINLNIDKTGYFKGKIYNGNNFIVKNVVVTVSVIDDLEKIYEGLIEVGKSNGLSDEEAKNSSLKYLAEKGVNLTVDKKRVSKTRDYMFSRHVSPQAAADLFAEAGYTLSKFQGIDWKIKSAEY